MATIHYRSRLVVSVKKHPALEHTFPDSAPQAARTYLLELRAQGLRPVIFSQENNFLIRIREKDHPELTFTCPSHAEAMVTAQRIEAERHTGLYKDYTQGRKVTLVEVIRRYYFERCPSHTGCDVERYTLMGLYTPRYAGTRRECAGYLRFSNTPGMDEDMKLL